MGKRLKRPARRKATVPERLQTAVEKAQDQNDPTVNFYVGVSKYNMKKSEVEPFIAKLKK